MAGDFIERMRRRFSHRLQRLKIRSSLFRSRKQNQNDHVTKAQTRPVQIISQPSNLHFLNLPAEIRGCIYSHLNNDGRPDAPVIFYISPGGTSNNLKEAPYAGLATLSRTCKLLHKEVADELYGKHVFTLVFSNYSFELLHAKEPCTLAFLPLAQHVLLRTNLTRIDKATWAVERTEKMLRRLGALRNLRVFKYEMYLTSPLRRKRGLEVFQELIDRAKMEDEDERTDGWTKEGRMAYAWEVLALSKEKLPLLELYGSLALMSGHACGCCEAPHHSKVIGD